MLKPLADAQTEVLDSMSILPLVRMPLRQARGAVLANDVLAPHDVPPFANSAVDGYAVRAGDVGKVPVELEVLEDVSAGYVATREVEPGTAIKIMTGAPIPAGAEAVVRVEDTEVPSRSGGAGGSSPRTINTVRILAGVAAGTAVRPAGGDVAAGSRVMVAGTRLNAVHLAVLATIGVASPEVHRRARVAVMSTGDELKPADTPELALGSIRDSNRPLLLGLLDEMGADVHDYGIIRDDADTLRRTLAQAVAETDAILTSGGVSMGEYDLVKQILTELGGISLWRVAMQPAKPFAFGLIEGVPLFGLPGNPVSVLVAFEQFVRPALLTMMGAARIFRPQVPGRMGENVETDPEKTIFLRVTARIEGGEWIARLAGGQGSNVLSAAAAADAMAVVPVGVGSVEQGDRVLLEMFHWPETRTREEALG